jgi:hypothetical protein
MGLERAPGASLKMGLPFRARPGAAAVTSSPSPPASCVVHASCIVHRPSLKHTSTSITRSHAPAPSPSGDGGDDHAAVAVPSCARACRPPAAAAVPCAWPVTRAYR